MLPWYLCVSFLVITALTLKLLTLKKAMTEITQSLAECLGTDTNTLLSVSSRDRHLRKLAAELNIQLRLLRGQRRKYLTGDLELKEAVTNISHDLRTPLTAIFGYLDLLKQEEKSETVNRYVAILKNRAELLHQLTDELFRYSIIIAEENSLQQETVVINAVLEDSIAAFYAVFQEQRITPAIEITEKKVIRQLDPSALSRVFSNLLQNALRYSDGDLDICLDSTGEIIFSNTASQLNEVQVGKLFDRFYTVEAARHSTGLGLAIARTLVEQMGGTILARYENGMLHICIYFP